MRTTNAIASPVSRFGATMMGFAVGAALAAAGCSFKQENARLVSEKSYLAAENRRISDALEARNVEMRALEVTLLEVRNGLDEIRGKELGAIRASIPVAREVGASRALREDLREEIRTIREAVHENLARLARLEERNKESGLRAAALERRATELKRSLEEKETVVTELEHRVRDLSATVKTQAASLREKDAALREGEARLLSRRDDGPTVPPQRK